MTPRIDRDRQPEKLKAVRDAIKFSFPAPEIEQMLAEIERGRRENELLVPNNPREKPDEG
jgi:hypothetical protein